MTEELGSVNITTDLIKNLRRIIASFEWDEDDYALMEYFKGPHYQLLDKLAKAYLELKNTRPPAQAAKGEWGPIETAPKDGTKFWAISKAAPQGFICHWQIHKHQPGMNDWEHADDYGHWVNCKPTHWQPLPQPPQPKE